MSTSDFDATLVTLKKNDPNEIRTVCETLLRILAKIQQNPHDLKSRTVLLESDDVLYNLMPFEGGLEILFDIGFKEDNDSLVLPLSVNSDQLKPFELKIKSLLDGFKSNEPPKCAPTQPPQSKPPNMLNSKFASKLISSFEHVMMYEEPSLRQKALGRIPVERLREQAKIAFDSFSSDTGAKDSNPPLDFDDFLLVELTSWFKNEFFSWTNQPDCDNCQSNEWMRFVKNDRPIREEIIWMAGNVEVYECQQCKRIKRFARYNHPGKLLDTRTGRCGEWANCFCLCLRALELDARYVVDWGDHVWCEVFSRSQKRWIHADPCENALDKPLMYEVGWQKKISYVIAFSRHECIDVTWRYIMDQKEVMKRRNECNELWLVEFTNELSARRQLGLSREERGRLQMRKLTELVEFMSEKKIKDGEDVGRQSGSLQWRMTRGEFQPKPTAPSYEFKLRPIGPKKRIHVRYNTVRNLYLVSEPDGPEETCIKNWTTATYRHTNIQLKVEHDWKMCYLARTCGSERALIEWCFSLVDSSVPLKAIVVKFETKCFESGLVKLVLELVGNESTGREIILSEPNQPTDTEVSVRRSNDVYEIDLSRVATSLRAVKLRAEMWSGSGENAWQHTQLFRQSLKDDKIYLFDLGFQF